MHLYQGTTQRFVADATQARLANQLSDRFFDEFRYRPAPSEVTSWRNSLSAMAHVLQVADLTDQGILVELKMPLSSKRLDVPITGSNPNTKRDSAVIVELKQWTEVGRSNITDCETIVYGGKPRDTLHPSRQVAQYQRYRPRPARCVRFPSRPAGRLARRGPPDDGGQLEPDVRVGKWSMPWNARDGVGRLGPGIPKSDFWASAKEGIDQVGCVYTAQGFEFDYVGVIVGPDLVYRPMDGGWLGQRDQSHDRVVRRGVTEAEFTRYVKSTYRVLLTRGLRGCYLYFMDAPTRDFFLGRTERVGHQAIRAAEATSEYGP